MNIDIDTPEITLLLRDVELKAAIMPRLVSDFELLADRISSCGERLSQSTLERLWQYSTRRRNTVSQHTLNVLSRYAGYTDWEAFRLHVKANTHPESGQFTEGIIDVEALQKDAVLTLCWLPDRKIAVRYQGDRRFEVVESLNSSLRPGDTFECTQIQSGQPLYLDRFSRAEAPIPHGQNARYVVGRDSGLTSVEIQ